jgi:hypothetical protein
MTEADKQKLTNVMKFDVSERQRLRRAALAQEAGLPAEAFAVPYAENQTINVTKTESSGWLARAIATAATLGFLGTGGALVYQNANSPAPITRHSEIAAPAPKSETAPPKQLRVRWWIENGQLQHQVETLP